MAQSSLDCRTSIIHDSPASYFRIAVREAKCRAKLCEQYSQVLDEIALSEESLGKGIVKVTHKTIFCVKEVLTHIIQISSINRAHSREGWPTAVNALWDNVCSAEERLGKQHIGFSLCISHSISRELNEHWRVSSPHLDDIHNKV